MVLQAIQDTGSKRGSDRSRQNRRRVVPIVLVPFSSSKIEVMAVEGAQGVLVSEDHVADDTLGPDVEHPVEYAASGHRPELQTVGKQPDHGVEYPDYSHTPAHIEEEAPDTGVVSPLTQHHSLEPSAKAIEKRGQQQHSGNPGGNRSGGRDRKRRGTYSTHRHSIELALAYPMAAVVTNEVDIAPTNMQVMAATCSSSSQNLVCPPTPTIAHTSSINIGTLITQST